MITLDTIQLPNSVVWINEFEWTPTQQSKTYTLTGALVIETAQKQAGRPIVLEGRQDSGWVKRNNIDALFSKLSSNDDMTLTLHDNRVFTVVFDHEAKPIESKPIQDFPIPKNAQPYTLILRLLVVS